MLASRENCQRSPDLVNDFFGLSTRYLKYKRVMFFQCSQLESFVTILLNAVGLESYESANEHSRFIRELLKVLEMELFQGQNPPDPNDPTTLNKQHMWNYFKLNGGRMISTYFSAILQVPPKDVAHIFNETIGVLVVTFMEQPEPLV